MIKITHVKELNLLADVPLEVVNVARNAVTILDEAYGEDRDSANGYGGCVFVIDSKDDFEQLRDLRVDLDTVMPEYVDIVECANGQALTSTLILLGSEFGVVLIMPLILLPANLKDYLYAAN